MEDKHLVCPYCGQPLEIGSRGEYGYGGEVFEHPIIQCTGCEATWDSNGVSDYNPT